MRVTGRRSLDIRRARRVIVAVHSRDRNQVSRLAQEHETALEVEVIDDEVRRELDQGKDAEGRAELLADLVQAPIDPHLPVEMLLHFVELSFGLHEALDLPGEPLSFLLKPLHFAHGPWLGRCSVDREHDCRVVVKRVLRPHRSDLAVGVEPHPRDVGAEASSQPLLGSAFC
jgi:hypothetical protein